jgi:large subunit ribosomal protein L13e
LDANVKRLKEYAARLVVFPRHKTPKKGDASWEEATAAKAAHAAAMPAVTSAAAPVEFVPVTEAMKKFRAYATLRQARADVAMVGARKKAAAKGKEDGPTGNVDE